MSFSKIKVLMLNVNRDGWHSGNMIYDMMAVQSACDTKTYGPGWPGYDTTDLTEIIAKLYGDDKPDYVVEAAYQGWDGMFIELGSAPGSMKFHGRRDEGQQLLGIVDLNEDEIKNFHEGFKYRILSLEPVVVRFLYEFLATDVHETRNVLHLQTERSHVGRQLISQLINGGL